MAAGGRAGGGPRIMGKGQSVEALRLVSAAGQLLAVSEDGRGSAASGDRWVGEIGHLTLWKGAHMGEPWRLT